MESDGFYAIGASHRVCQDYARAGQVQGRVTHFAIVSDGCSGSEDSDLGARLLVNAAEHRLRLFAADYDHDWIVRRAAAAVSMLGAPSSCLDATLLSAFVVDEERVRVCVSGDGVVAARRRDGALVSWEFCDGGAPAYLSYRLDARRYQCYLDSGYGRRRITRRVDGALVGRREHDIQTDGFVSSLDLPVDDFELLMLFSDGAASFEGPGLEANDVIEQLCAIKSHRGAFVERRCRRFLGKYCSARGWVHQDDLAVAALHLGAS
jgi:hypothetical protein